MKRHIQILAGILIIQIVFGVIVFWPRSAATAGSEPIFPGVEADDIVALTITDDNGNSVALRQVTGDWVLPEADDYLAQASKVTPLTEKLVGLTTGRLVTRTDASHKRLQVDPDDFVRRIELETADGTKRTLYLGSSPSYGALHFRVHGESEAYLSNDITTWEANATASSWVDTLYLSVPQEEITRLTLENANGTFAFTKDGDGQWTVAGLAASETLDETKITDSLSRAATINLRNPLGKEEQAGYGMDAPAALITLETEGKTVTVLVGAQNPDDKTHVVKSSESPYYVQVSEFSVKSLVEQTLDGFLQLPPTPVPAGG